ncbi:MAG: 2Fe-2S iron-sulfur cluster-binding protein [Desulfobacterota bacterium]|nr:2Fe-2S iron-sulfur cluster-binding protein [Thermodesulfobacteriota bacterium]
MSTVTVIIDKKKYRTEQGEMILRVARREGIDIPALCYHEGLSPFGACRLCMVEVVAGGRPGITTSCTLAATDGLEVKTATDGVVKIRRGLLELYLAQAPDAPSLRQLAAQHGVTHSRFVRERQKDAPEEKCVLCGLCVRVCNEAVGAGVINFTGRGPETKVTTPYREPSNACIGCTACAQVCPTEVIQIADVRGIRSVITWSDTKVALKQCRICGRTMEPEPLVQEVHRKIIDLSEEFKDVCIKCRQRYRTVKLHHMDMAKTK